MSTDAPAPPTAAAQTVRVLVVDDEPLGRLRVEDLLRAEPDVEVVGAAEDGLQAVAAIRALRPDLVFLDVQMPGLTGLDVVREIGPEAMPATIFVTAYDHYAVGAFEAAAVDYLVKPFDDERFEEALRRARRRLALERAAPPPEEPPEPPRYLERIAVEVRGRVVPVPVATIDYITASGPYAELHAGGQRHLIREAMQTLEERLDPAAFMRVHRSVIVRLARVEALHKAPGGDYQLQLKGGGRLRVSRPRREALERWLGVRP